MKKAVFGLLSVGGTMRTNALYQKNVLLVYYCQWKMNKSLQDFDKK